MVREVVLWESEEVVWLREVVEAKPKLVSGITKKGTGNRRRPK